METYDQPPFTDVDVIGEGLFKLMDPKLGQGGQASVYRAQDIADPNRQLAVKVVECEMEDLNKGNPSILARFQSEARTWHQFSSSSYVVKLHFTFRYRLRFNNRAYLCFVMELAELGDLSKNLTNRSLFLARRRIAIIS